MCIFKEYESEEEAETCYLISTLKIQNDARLIQIEKRLSRTRKQLKFIINNNLIFFSMMLIRIC